MRLFTTLSAALIAALILATPALADTIELKDGRMVEGVVVRPMVDPIRYRYAIYSPRYRPITVIARNLLSAWQDEVMKLLEDAGFNPQLES